MNNKLYGNLIFELSRPGRRAYSLPKNRFAHHELPAELRREQDAELPECDEMTATIPTIARTTSVCSTASIPWDPAR